MHVTHIGTNLQCTCNAMELKCIRMYCFFFVVVICVITSYDNIVSQISSSCLK